jgi:hypothetical protein
MPDKKKTPKKSATKDAAARKTAPKKKSASPRARTTAATAAAPPASAGDVIVIDSEKVGSPPREGEVLEVVQGQVSISYLVRWTDGHQSLIAPGAGNTRIVPPQTKR